MSEENILSPRRNKKVAGVEDPIVIVQRLLNIFRQMHILDDKQKADFNNMILQQPPEIRHMCNVLPGGSVLQEYIDDLEEQNGINPNQNLGFSDIAPDTSNILASALATDNQPQAKESQPQTAQNNNINAQTLELQKQMLLMMKNMQNQPQPQYTNQPAAQTIVKPDAAFAQDIAAVISKALTESDEKRSKELYLMTQALTKSQQQQTASLLKELTAKENSASIVSTAEGNVKVIDNTKEITKAITESQLEMAKMFLQQNAINANNNANNANNIQINNVPFPNQQDLIADIIKAQSQLFREMAKEQTKEISTIISGALKESNHLSNQFLIKALSEFQKENLNFLKQQAQQKTVLYQPLPNVVGSDVQPADFDYKQTHQDKEEGATAGFKRVFSNMFNRAQNKQQEQEVDVNNLQNQEMGALPDVNDVFNETEKSDTLTENLSDISDDVDLETNLSEEPEDTISKKKKKK